MAFRFDRDGHVHSGFCPHGSGDPTRAFIERAITLGFSRLSIVEHFPLPPDFPPPPTSYPVSMDYNQIEPYLEETLALRKEFKGKIDLLIGFEFDYLPGREGWLKNELDKIGPRIQDGLLSVHFLKESIIDETAEYFMRDVLPKVGGSLDSAYREYYRTVLAGVKADLGPYKPNRLAHLNLIRKFRLKHAPPGEYREEILEIANEAANRGMQLDYNMSGIRRPLCGEPYLPDWLIGKIANGEIDIEVVYGSDAHGASSVGAGILEAKAKVLSALSSNIPKG